MHLEMTGMAIDASTWSKVVSRREYLSVALEQYCLQNMGVPTGDPSTMRPSLTSEDCMPPPITRR